MSSFEKLNNKIEDFDKKVREKDREDLRYFEKKCRGSLDEELYQECKRPSF